MSEEIEKNEEIAIIEKAPQVFEKRFIKTGLSDGIKIQVLEGLSKEDKIKGPEKKNTPENQDKKG